MVTHSVGLGRGSRGPLQALCCRSQREWFCLADGMPSRGRVVARADTSVSLSAPEPDDGLARPVGDPSGEASVSRGGCEGSGGDPERLRRYLRNAVAGGRMSRALKVLDQLRECSELPEEATYKRLVKELCQKDRFVDAWGVYVDLSGEGMVLSGAVMRTLIGAAVKCGEIELALDVLHEMKERGMDPGLATYTQLISALGKDSGYAGRGSRQQALDFSLELWDEMHQSGSPLDGAAYNVGLNAMVSNGSMDEAEGLLREMVEAGVMPGVNTFNILIKGYGEHGGAADSMLAVVRDMKAAGLTPDIVTYNSLVAALVQRGEVHAAAGTIQLAERNGVAMDVRGYTALVKGHVAQSDIPGAVRVFRLMEAAGVAPNEVTFSTLMDGHVRAGRNERAEAVLEEMLSRGLSPSVVTYNILLRGLSRGGEVEKAFAAIRVMGERGIAPNLVTYNTLLDACITGGQAGAATKIFRRMVEEGPAPNVVTYTTLVKAFGQLGRADDAARVFAKMASDPAVVVDEAAHLALIDCFATSGEMSRAFEAARGMEAAGWRMSLASYGSLVKGLSAQREREQALDLLATMERDGIAPDDRIFNALVDVCVRTRALDTALGLVDRMEREGINPDKLRMKKMFIRLYRSELEDYDGAIEREMQLGELGSLGRGEEEGGGEGREGEHREGESSRVTMERFKFWLGLPNDYYSSD